MEIIDELVNWFTAPSNRIFLWIVIGIVGVIVLLWVLSLFAKFAKLSFHKEFSVDNREANLLALGFQQITNSNNYWNDPTASFNGASERKNLQEMWGLYSAQDVYDNVERLTTERRRRELWQQLLALRAEAAKTQGGNRPSARQWLAAIKDAGGTGKGEERDFVGAVHYYEKEINKKLFPADEPVVSFDAYALGQAVAVCTWSVGLGLITREESLSMIEKINGIARDEFDSWAAFGRSYVLGRAMHWSEGTMDEQRAKQAGEAASAAITALDGKRRGPWGILPWKI